MPTTTNTSDWSPSVDIYNIVESIDALKKRYIEDEDETTLAVGLFGFIGDTESKKIQTAAIMTGELGNEMFPQRAKLDKNIITHATYSNIEDLNAVPSSMTINIAIREADLDLYMKNNEFVFDHENIIKIGEYDFHFDYDIVLKRYKRANSSNWTYSARYDMDVTNNISDISMPYLAQPYIMNFNNNRYVFFQSIVRQVSLNTIEDVMVSASVIDNKSFTFTFTDQLVTFDVYITENGKTIRLLPYMYGQAVETGIDDYCWYLYMNDDTIRIGFDQKSYMPGLNASIRIVTYTTLGSAGIFSYKSTDADAGIYVDFASDRFGYKKVTCIVTCDTDSIGGKDKKSIEELKSLIPKMGMSRGNITTETDINNYFNLISDDTNRVNLRRKIDNQRQNVWYCYMIMKDMYGNIIPSNTLSIKVDPTNDACCVACDGEDERYIIPCGTTFYYDKELDYARYIPENEVPEKFSDDFYADGKYYYRSFYNIILNTDPLYCAYYLSIINRDSYFQYNWVNESLDIGFIANSYHFERFLLSEKDTYRMSFSITQSINENTGLYYYFNEGTETTVVNNMKVYLVICKDGEPYRYTEAKVTYFDETIYQLSYEVTLKTDDQFDINNRIKLLNLGEVGYDSTNDGFFDEKSQAFLYIYGKFDDEYGRNGTDKIIPGLQGYSLINTYELVDGLVLFENYTNVVNTRVRKNISSDQTQINYDISGIPLIGEHYFLSEDHVIYFLNQLDTKKAYIDYCLSVLENNMDIDLKFYNTYGESKTFTLGNVEKTGIGHIDLTFNFRLKLVNTSDTYTKQSIVNFIKAYIENINDSAEEELHIPNLLHDIKEEYHDLIVYIEFMNFNDNRLGLNHIELRGDIENVYIPQEFLCVRNRLSDDGLLEPCIDIELVV